MAYLFDMHSHNNWLYLHRNQILYDLTHELMISGKKMQFFIFKKNEEPPQQRNKSNAIEKKTNSKNQNGHTVKTNNFICFEFGDSGEERKKESKSA